MTEAPQVQPISPTLSLWTFNSSEEKEQYRQFRYWCGWFGYDEDDKPEKVEGYMWVMRRNAQ